MPRKRRLVLTPEEALALQAVLNLEHASEHLRAQIHGRDAEVSRAMAMARAAMDGMPRSIQYAAILALATHCLQEMQRAPESCPDD